MSTLCLRYIKERDRFQSKEITKKKSKFTHFNDLRFLDENREFQNRNYLYEYQNSKLIEIYKHFPVLWHIAYKSVPNTNQRSQAYQSIFVALKLCGIYLSVHQIITRLRLLIKKYSKEKVRILQSLINGQHFEMTFRHFKAMNYLDKHIRPFVCVQCGKIFETNKKYTLHLKSALNHENLRNDMLGFGTVNKENIIVEAETVALQEDFNLVSVIQFRYVSCPHPKKSKYYNEYYFLQFTKRSFLFLVPIRCSRYSKAILHNH